jgi:hypothetical protein
VEPDVIETHASEPTLPPAQPRSESWPSAGPVSSRCASGNVGIPDSVRDVLARVRSLGAQLELRPSGGNDADEGERLFLEPARAYAQLTDSERATLHEHRETIKALLRDGCSPIEPEPVAATPSTAPVAEPTPVLYAYGVLVTAEHVLDALRSLGDDVLARYVSGRLSKREAYSMAQRGLRQTFELQEFARRARR